ncbi:MAG: hypothetical protein AAF384_09360 [Pseudomonadota bacterium]
MSSLTPVEDAFLSTRMKALVAEFEFDPEYANGLKIFAHKQEVFEPIWSAYRSMLENGKLDRDLKELVRLKIAQNNDCSPYVEKQNLRRLRFAPEIAASLSEEKIAAVGAFEVSEVLTKREKLALKFAEKLGIEPESLDDEFFEDLRSEFPDEEIVELAHVAAVGIGFERFLAVWQPRVCALDTR